MRGVEERIVWFLANKPEAAGLCLKHTRMALDLPWVAPDASTAYRALAKAGRISKGDAPKGALLWWTGGAKGHGHVAIATGGGKVASTDVKGSRTVGTVPLEWFARKWPSLAYRGWSWHLGEHNTQPAPVVVQAAAVTEAPAPKGGLSKLHDVKVARGTWVAYARKDLAAGRHWDCTMQIRLPKGVSAEFRLARMGWGDLDDMANNIDGTGYQYFPPRHDDDQGQSRTHPIAGGGPVEWQILVPGTGQAVIPTLVAKWAPK